MGTVFSFDVRGVRTGPLRTALRAAVALLHDADRVFSTYREDSDISRLRRGEVALSGCAPEVAEVLRLCEDAERASGGLFTAGYAGGGPDPTGLVKGWAVERAARLLASAGAEAVCVNGGGDVQLIGGPWRVGIADPLRPGALAAVVEHTAGGLAVATSGPAERGCHIIDPRTGAPPVTALASVTVVHAGLTDADARATAAYAMGDEARDWLESLPDTGAFAVTADGGSWRTGTWRTGCLPSGAVGTGAAP
ncbi:FAD:protein FMN transferase [Streptomyces sp. GC420]|uniref:FAD:protein FMN transferase n=1 Tax=Streptomyces sp. GC420 TaxID=2697568 RepID=UPI0014150C96|nr:FAD:protein FMN transferase [Streptomyces sp. GC420]NBM20511.1 FAD:protein FMN transferase [Streptomyces sp. GC420]